ncbi:hypothetical protein AARONPHADGERS_133 [Bacillus phage AaronPhadgers]|uniref:hypothetical protein n=1 Tax=Bacillus phage Zuko TaxID=1805956 RepID=UPI0007A776F1|nr:hypothetical protein BI001_gp248 [Bacillus phage Zuko]AMW62355.1 hypothetical protein ZUKO_130 [Bacillus phage Zuko]ASR78785.1 hypothetical protein AARONPHADGERS_133 [Bacillus phage AaronPhadgers]
MHKSDKSYINKLVEELAATVDHGECFYDETEMNEYLDLLTRLRERSVALFIHNQRED